LDEKALVALRRMGLRGREVPTRCFRKASGGVALARLLVSDAGLWCWMNL
jgi:hypothetical protein